MKTLILVICLLLPIQALAGNMNPAPPAGAAGLSGTPVLQGICSGTMSGSRWCDNGDGTIRDMSTGLFWLKEANCSAHLGGINKAGLLSWQDARAWSAYVRSGSCGLTDGSVMGDWRVPTLAEMTSILKGLDPVRPGSPGLFKHVQPSDYWTNTTDSVSESTAWAANHGNGSLHAWLKSSYSYVWAVRNGR